MELTCKTGRNYPAKRKKIRVRMGGGNAPRAIKKRQTFCLALLP